ncbi:Ig domain-containing protein [Ruania suaedae]|uniref:Ig domain-containing protein n=1 Tax=Ruania suaedae TaxID=2897774 RepID=UPI001E641A37|nr:Ig domain-containing protein [Ruania suaedae]UFU04080.1 Ig domain-containing protein [Ruania suaedae]
MMPRPRTLARVRTAVAVAAVAALAGLGIVAAAPSASAAGVVVIDDFAGTTLGERTVTASTAMGGTQASTFTESGGVGVFSIGGQGNTQGSVRLDYAFPEPTDLTEGWTNTRISFPFESIQRVPEDNQTALVFALTIRDSDGNSDTISSGIASTGPFDASFPLLCEGTLCFDEVDPTRASSVTLELLAPRNFDRDRSVDVRLQTLRAAPPVGTPEGPLTPTVTTASTDVDAQSPRSIDFTVSFASDDMLEGTTQLQPGDLDISGTAAGLDNVTVTGGPSVWQVRVGPLTSDGTVSVGVPAGIVTGLASRPNIASTGDPVVNFDLAVAPSIASADAVSFAADEAGAFTIVSSGDPTPVVDLDGGLPSGVTFEDSGDGTGSLSGTPQPGTGGTYPLTVTASNGTSPDAVQNLTLTVTEVPVFVSGDAVTFTAGSLGEFVVEVGAGFPGPVSIGSESVVPEGLSLVDNGDGTALLSGTAVAGGVSVLELVATNGAGLSAEQSLTVTVEESPVFVSGDAVTFTAGSLGEFVVEVGAGFPGPVSIGSESVVPEGLSLVDNGDGTALLSGTAVAGGVSVLELVATNGAGLSAEQSLTVTVEESPVFVSGDVVTFTAGLLGEFVVEVGAGFPGPVSIGSESVVPEGLSLVDNGDGTASLSGTAVAGGVSVLELVATNGAGLSAEQSLTVTVVQSPALVTEPSLELIAGVPGELVLETAPGFPADTALRLAGDLPAGVTFTDNGDGTATISGNAGPDVVGEYPVTVTASNELAPDTVRSGTVTVALAPAVILPEDQPTSDGALTGVPAETVVGQEITVTGTGFAAGAPVTLGLYSDLVPLGTATADAEGEFTATLVIPDRPGEHLVVAGGVSASGEVQYLSASTTISALQVPADGSPTVPADGSPTVPADGSPAIPADGSPAIPGDDSPTLPTTGTVVGGALASALVLAFAGAVLVRRSRSVQA